jgi:2-polyprenyl-3-methyl-5-hydroxy-6-metoxy-1,4-benzoquinol methylase
MQDIETPQNKMNWGEEPELTGPRDYFRNTLLINEVMRYKSKGSLMDFGCGSGHLLMRLAKKGYKCVGIDASDTAIRFLNERVEKQRINNITTIEADDQQLKNISQTFDIIVSGETIEHIKDDQGLVNSFYNALNGDGICVISTPAHMYLWDKNDDFSSHFKRYETDELKSMFEKAGFMIEKAYYWGYPLTQIWHTQLYNRLIENKIEKKVNYSKQSPVSFLSKNQKVTELLSWPFYFDQLFNWTKKGGGIILVARKK